MKDGKKRNETWKIEEFKASLQRRQEKVKCDKCQEEIPPNTQRLHLGAFNNNVGDIPICLVCVNRDLTQRLTKHIDWKSLQKQRNHSIATNL